MKNKKPQLWLAVKYDNDKPADKAYNWVVVEGPVKRLHNPYYTSDVMYRREVFWPCSVAMAALGLKQPTAMEKPRRVAFKMSFVRPTAKAAKRKTTRRTRRAK